MHRVPGRRIAGYGVASYFPGTRPGGAQLEVDSP
jgi:hypothetical protein